MHVMNLTSQPWTLVLVKFAGQSSPMLKAILLQSVPYMHGCTKHACRCTCWCVWICVCVRVWWPFVHMCPCVCVWVCMSVCAHVCVHVQECLNECAQVDVWVCLFKCVLFPHVFLPGPQTIAPKYSVYAIGRWPCLHTFSRGRLNEAGWGIP